MATVPVEKTFSAGSVLTAGQLNTNLRDGINYLIGPPLFVCRQTANQSIPDTTVTAETFDTNDKDSDNGHSTVTNPTRYTAATAGWWSLKGIYGYASIASAGVIRNARFRINGVATYYGGVVIGTVANGAGALGISADLFLNVADYVEIVVQQFNSGSALNTDSTYGQPRFSGLWIST